MSTYSLTEHGKVELEDELLGLRDAYDQVVERVTEARAHGDLSENAEYASARDEQRRVQGRIDEIENILENAEIITGNANNSGEAGLGSRVVLSDGTKYEIVGSLEADPLDGKISNESPLGKELVGKKVGDIVELKMAKKSAKQYTIKNID